MHATTKRVGSAISGKSPKELGDFQARLAQEGAEIIEAKLALKIQELDGLCMKPEYAQKRAQEIRQDTIDALQHYMDECKRIEKKESSKKGGMNPLAMLLGGGLSMGGPEAEEGDEESSLCGEEESVQLPKKLLLDKIALDNSNKVSLKLSLELDVPESKKAEDDSASEPQAKKRKTEDAESEEKSEKKDSKQGEEDKKEEEEEEDEEPPVISSNIKNRDFATMLRGHIDEIVDWCTTLRAWLQSNISRNKNIGGADLKGEIQNEMLAEIQAVEQELLNHKEVMAAYYVARAGIMEKYVKSPEFEDYKVFVVDEDEKHWVSLRAILIQMRNQTMSLYDAIIKESDELFSSGTSDKNDSFGFGSMY